VPLQDYVQAGALMAYAVDLAELLRRMADDVHQILKGAKPVFTMQVEVLRRLRNGSQQLVRVEHIHINEGGRAIIGNVKKADR
jgi:ABC-type uncharacterized transport system substrate-binding protein